MRIHRRVVFQCSLEGLGELQPLIAGRWELVCSDRLPQHCLSLLHFHPPFPEHLSWWLIGGRMVGEMALQQFLSLRTTGAE